MDGRRRRKEGVGLFASRQDPGRSQDREYARTHICILYVVVGYVEKGPHILSN